MGTVTNEGINYVALGAETSFTITPDVGYEIDKLTIDGSEISAQLVVPFRMVTASHTLMVTFKKISVVADPVITAAAGIGGTISPLGDSAVPAGTVVNYAITPDADHVIEDVVVNDVVVNGVSLGAEATVDVTVTENSTIAAGFSKLYNLDVAYGTGSGKYKAGTGVAITPDSQTGHRCLKI